MKEDIADLAVNIHIQFMEARFYEPPSFFDLLHESYLLYEPESTADLRKIADAIDECVNHWDEWTAEWLCELQEAKAQQRDENRLRGEI